MAELSTLTFCFKIKYIVLPAVHHFKHNSPVSVGLDIYIIGNTKYKVLILVKITYSPTPHERPFLGY